MKENISVGEHKNGDLELYPSYIQSNLTIKQVELEVGEWLEIMTQGQEEINIRVKEILELNK